MSRSRRDSRVERWRRRYNVGDGPFYRKNTYPPFPRGHACARQALRYLPTRVVWDSRVREARKKILTPRPFLELGTNDPDRVRGGPRQQENVSPHLQGHLRQQRKKKKKNYLPPAAADDVDPVDAPDVGEGRTLSSISGGSAVTPGPVLGSHSDPPPPATPEA